MKKHIIIIGGGLAGLSAAYTLAKTKEYTLELLESENQLGGRVKTIQIDGERVDIGGFIVMPWYKQFLSLVNELNLKKSLHPIPESCRVLYQLQPGGPAITLKEMKPPLKHEIKLLFAVFKALLFKKRLNVYHPNLKVYKNTTVQEYVIKLFGKNSIYKTFIGSESEGYGFAPIHENKTAFFAPIAYKTKLKKYNEPSSYYFKQGCGLLIDALKDKLLAQGVKLRAGMEVTGFEKGRIQTQSGTEYKADRFIFANTVDSKLHSQLLDSKVNSVYTEYFTVVMRLEKPINVGRRAWGALFFGPNPERKHQIMSLVNLYRSFNFKHPNDVMVNMVVRERSGEAISNHQLKEILEQDPLLSYPEKNRIVKIHHVEHWKKMMPVSQEDFVEKVREKQGKNGVYFAGDFLGCPSMETAVATGIEAAKQLMKDTSS